MDAVTYPDARVVAEIDRSFAAFKVNMLERHPDFREACAGGRVMWGPTLIVADSRGSELRRWCGWLPPESFAAELTFCRATADFHHGKFAEAHRRFARLAEDAGGTEIHPEALYWQGAAGFLAGGKDLEALRTAWTDLIRRYPGHRFATHASVIDDA